MQFIKSNGHRKYYYITSFKNGPIYSKKKKQITTKMIEVLALSTIKGYIIY